MVLFSGLIQSVYANVEANARSSGESSCSASRVCCSGCLSIFGRFAGACSSDATSCWTSAAAAAAAVAADADTEAYDRFATVMIRSTFRLMMSGSFDSRTCWKHCWPTPYAFDWRSSAISLNLRDASGCAWLVLIFRFGLGRFDAGELACRGYP